MRKRWECKASEEGESACRMRSATVVSTMRWTCAACRSLGTLDARLGDTCPTCVEELQTSLVYRVIKTKSMSDETNTRKSALNTSNVAVLMASRTTTRKHMQFYGMLRMRWSRGKVAAIGETYSFVCFY